MQQRQTPFRRRPRHGANGQMIDLFGVISVCFGLIDSCVGGRVDDHVCVCCHDRRTQHIGRAKVCLVAAQTNDLHVACAVLQGGGHLAGFTEDEDLHALVPKRVPTPSRA